MSIKIINAAVDRTGDKTIIRGVIDPDSLNLIKSDDYQRTSMENKKTRSLRDALRTGERPPDIELGVRGTAFSWKSGDKGAISIEDPTYVIDGLQRISQALKVMEQGGRAQYLGATIYMDTNPEWERKRFEPLNAGRSPLAPGIMIRNMRHDHPGFEMLYNLSFDRSFVLGHKIAWNQFQKRDELIKASVLVKSIAELHNWAGSGRGHTINDVANGLDTMMMTVGRTTLRNNTREFFEIVDRAFGVRTIAYRTASPQIKGAFLFALGKVFSRHWNFWSGERKDTLSLSADEIRKLGAFPINDPTVGALAGASGGMAAAQLARMIADHFNSGKKLYRLTDRPQWESQPLKRLQPNAVG